MTWTLEPADDDHLAVLATCWGVPVDDARDRDRVWVQSTEPGDAPGPRVVRLHDRVLTVLDRPDAAPARWVPRMVGLRGLVRPADVAAPGAARIPVTLLGPDYDAAALALHAVTPAADLEAASPLPSAAHLSVGTFDGADLVGIAAVVATPAGPPEISVLVGPGARGRGLALAMELDLLRRAAGRWDWVQHRTVLGDVASQRLAAACRFRLVSVEHLVRPARSSDDPADQPG